MQWDNRLKERMMKSYQRPISKNNRSAKKIKVMQKTNSSTKKFTYIPSYVFS